MKLTRSLAAAGMAALVTVSATGCSLGPNAIFAATSSADFTVTARFASVLNLPVGAAVQVNGLKLGEVVQMSDSGQGIDVKLGFQSGAKVPADASARIQQDTLLGDTYVAILVPEKATDDALLRDGGKIPLDRTFSPPQLEDTIAVLANFVNGGSIQRAQETMATLNRTMPSVKEVRALSSTVAVDLRDLGGRTAVIDKTMNTLISGAKTFDTAGPAIKEMFSAQGAEYWEMMIRSIPAHLAILMPSVGSIFNGGLWLVPLLNSLDKTVAAGRGVWDKGEIALRELQALLTKAAPLAKKPQVDVVGVTDTAGRQATQGTREVLRVLGAIR